RYGELGIVAGRADCNQTRRPHGGAPPRAANATDRRQRHGTPVGDSRMPDFRQSDKMEDPNFRAWFPSMLAASASALLGDPRWTSGRSSRSLVDRPIRSVASSASRPSASPTESP